MAFYTNRRLLNHLLPPQNNHPPYITRNNNHWHYTEFDSRNFRIQNQSFFYLFILFSVILLITLILLYARWYFRFRHLQASTSPHIYRSQHPNEPHAPAKLTKGLDEAVVKAIPIVLHQGNGIEMECCICLGVFEDGDKVKVLHDCQHRFHSDCVDRWLFSQPTCPLCRVSLRAAPPATDDREFAQA